MKLLNKSFSYCVHHQNQSVEKIGLDIYVCGDGDEDTVDDEHGDGPDGDEEDHHQNHADDLVVHDGHLLPRDEGHESGGENDIEFRF